MLTEKDYCDYETCVALKELGYNQSSIAFYPCQDITVDCVDSNGDLYEAEYDKESLVLYSSLNLKNNKINKVQAPTLYEAQKWLREVKKIEVNATYDNVVELHWHWYMKSLINRNQTISMINHDSYESALLKAIKEAVKILKEKNINQRKALEAENTEFDYGHNVNYNERDTY